MKRAKRAILAAFLTIFAIMPARSQSLGDLLGGGLGNTIENVLEGVFSSSNITIADMAGSWTSTGPAVCFQGEGFLQKAGGVAAAAAIESKLQPYYERYGLNNATLEIDNAGNFTLKSGMLKLSGTITQNKNAQAGVFEFNFKALGGTVKLASVTTYVQKTSRSMDVMFDATKLKKLLSGVAKYSGIDLAKTMSSILDSYDGLCVGFKMNLTGNSYNGINNGLSNGSNNNSNSNSNSNNAINEGIGILRGILNGGK